MVEVYIAKDANIVKYSSEIRRCDSTLSIGDVRNAIINGTAAFSKELISYDDIYHEEVEGTDPHTRNMMFYSLIEKLIGMGAEVAVKKDGKDITPEQLKSEIMRIKDISEDTAKYPD